jgi:hypothetical protein
MKKARQPKVYVGCSLTQAPEEFKSSVEGFKDKLRTMDYDIFDFVGLVDGTARDVYEWDIKRCVGTCDIFVGICDYPSIGLGWELGEAVRLGKFAMAVAHADASVTRLVLGAAEAESSLQFERYTSLLTDVPPLVETLRAQWEQAQ